MSHHHKHGGCHDHDSCCSDDKCCDDPSCSCHHHHNHHHHKDDECCHEDFAQHLLHVADCAWMELLKEKIKQQIATTCGDQLDQIAKVVAESNQSRWNHKTSLIKIQHEYKDKLQDIFCCSSGTCKS